VTAERAHRRERYITGVEGRDRTATRSRRQPDGHRRDGLFSVLRKFNPIDSFIEREIEMDDMRRRSLLLEFDRGVEDETYFNLRYCIIHRPGHSACRLRVGLPKGKNKGTSAWASPSQASTGATGGSG